jgi:hypothetical protein
MSCFTVDGEIDKRSLAYQQRRKPLNPYPPNQTYPADLFIPFMFKKSQPEGQGVFENPRGPSLVYDLEPAGAYLAETLPNPQQSLRWHYNHVGGLTRSSNRDSQHVSHLILFDDFKDLRPVAVIAYCHGSGHYRYVHRCLKDTVLYVKPAYRLVNALLSDLPDL